MRANAGIVNDTTLIAIRLIARGEEIRFDYSTTMSQDTWTLECRCRAASCRGIVQNFEELPQWLQRRYLTLGIVQNFIRSLFETGTGVPPVSVPGVMRVWWV